jgi:hypothetical protein
MIFFLFMLKNYFFFSTKTLAKNRQIPMTKRK